MSRKPENEPQKLFRSTIFNKNTSFDNILLIFINFVKHWMDDKNGLKSTLWKALN